MAQLASVRALGAWGPGFESLLPDHFRIEILIMKIRFPKISSNESIHIKWIYGIVFGILGYIISFFVVLLFLGAIVGSLWIFVFGDKIWPQWSYYSLLLLFLLPWMTATVVSFIRGMQYGAARQKFIISGEEPRRSRLWLIVSILLLIVFVGYLNFKVQVYRNVWLDRKNAIEDVVNNMSQIAGVNLFQKDDSIEAIVQVKGKTDDKYRLILRFSSVGYVKNLLFIKTEPIALRFDQQEFVFQVAFSEIERAYRNKVAEYVPSFNQKFGVEEMLSLQTELVLEQSVQYPDINVEEIAATKVVHEGKLLFFFECLEDACHILQLPAEEKEKSITESLGQ